ncbi:MAG: leucine--tRNA ligase [Mycoplasma sp.]|nr:leucine--tRNA ligase [Mycoplasma sp.]
MYNHSYVEKKWIKKLEDKKINSFQEDNSKKKFYALDMFPYPSGAGLHVGHAKSYTPTDIIARYKKFQGFNVLHPIGWDAFGLPAEQYALKTKNHPEGFTLKNIENFRKQIKMLGYCFDEKKEVNTTDPLFYQWTQWIFIQLYKHGLAKICDIDVNWCQELGTVLANEEVLVDKDGNKVSERGNYPVVKKPMKQWVLRITEYCEKLIEGLDDVDWPIGLKNIQKKWIGKTEGAEINFGITNSKEFLSVFTSRPDTIFGATFIGISVDHFLTIENLKNNPKLNTFVNNVKNNQNLQRVNPDNLDKNGFLLENIFAIHPITKQKLPIYVCDYVLSNYGNGAVMGCPAHDSRDLEFAKKYKLKIIPVIDIKGGDITSDGPHINSDFLNGLNTVEAKEKIISYLIKNKIGKKAINYKLRDWIFSRQRYWGEPFPVLYDEEGNIKIIENLPVLLPKIDEIKPSGDGKSPLANLQNWVNVKIDGKMYKRETNTMPQWAGSSWYYLAYILKNSDGTYIPLNSKKAYEKLKHWLPVDVYIGGQEHAVLHLLYSRFWHRFLYDIKIVPTKEPFKNIINQGMILGSDGEKMSKSRGNVVNPTEVIKNYGADSLRLYIVFLGPITASLGWDENGIEAMYKWINRVWRLFETKKIVDSKNILEDHEKKYHNFIFKATELIEKYEFNMVISEMMIFINDCYKQEFLIREYMENFLIVLNCFAPFISEEINETYLKNKEFVTLKKWPKFDKKKLDVSEINVPVQINGKNRDILKVKKDITEQEIMKLVLSSNKLKPYLENKIIIKKIYVINRILNIIIK